MYEVIWSIKAEMQLAEMWIHAQDRNELSSIVSLIDIMLAQRPLLYGESRESSLNRAFFHFGIGVLYVVVPDDRRVLVQSVFMTG
ncbi:MAG: hypothetical protein ACRCZF_12700 [Gemmataceae bacterium]